MAITGDGTTPVGTPVPETVSRLSEDDALTLLREGEIELEGRLVDASNTTLRVFVSRDGVSARGVYKPVDGERPLWDFPDGTLAGREVSAYLVSSATGWDLVPPTVLRDGPLGSGALQLWIDEPAGAAPLVGFVPARSLPNGWKRIASARDEEGRPFSLAHADDTRLARLAILDIVINNADRKGGHVLMGPDDRVYGVDHGVTFHVEPKLRTVLWGWTGQVLPDEAVDVLGRLASAMRADLGKELRQHLTPAEVGRLRGRIRRLLENGCFPEPGTDWPAVPWPPM